MLVYWRVVVYIGDEMAEQKLPSYSGHHKDPGSNQ